MIEAEGADQAVRPHRRPGLRPASTSRSPAGSILGVLGPNGAGKTTALTAFLTTLSPAR